MLIYRHVYMYMYIMHKYTYNLDHICACIYVYIYTYTPLNPKYRHIQSLWKYACIRIHPWTLIVDTYNHYLFAARGGTASGDFVTASVEAEGSLRKTVMVEHVGYWEHDLNESWHTCKWVMAHIWMRRGTRVNETWTSAEAEGSLHVTVVIEHVSYWEHDLNESWLTCEWVMAHM